MPKNFIELTKLIGSPLIFAVREGIISDLLLLNNMREVLVVFRASLLVMVQSYNNDRFWLVMLSRLS